MSDNRLYLECSCGECLALCALYFGSMAPEAKDMLKAETLRQFLNDHTDHKLTWTDSMTDWRQEAE